MRLARTLVFILAFAHIQGANAAEGPNTQRANTPMKMKVGSTSFTATLEDNPTAAAFKAMLPMTIKMTELNGNEAASIV